MEPRFDFSGWATKNDLLCTDGRTIRKNAFKDNDGQTVPLVWQHQHNDPNNVLGHALLENRDEGVYAYCKFNNTESAQTAKELVQHKDVTMLSIYANQLKQNGGDVLHGVIREVSLVLAGANKGAFIDFPILAHGDEFVRNEEEAVIYTGEEFELFHAEEEPKEEPKEDKEEPKVADEKKERTVKDVFDEFTDEQKNVVYFMIGQALEDAGVSAESEGEEAEHSDNEEGENEMKHNVFDNDTPRNILSHDDMKAIFSDAKRLGSLKDAVLQHMESGVLSHIDVTDGENGVSVSDPSTSSGYGLYDLNYLFPNYRETNNPPEFIQRDMGWVRKVMGGAHHTPFSRIKSTFANITEDDARALGYIKGNAKKNEVFALLKRATDPQTVYKKQKMDRDDIIDITDFNVVAWLKSEMRMMLDEELARAILIGDGRNAASDDKISEDHIRSIVNDNPLFTVPVVVADDDPKKMIRAIIRARKNYKGSGRPTFFTSEDVLTEMLLLEDNLGHELYADEAALARKLRVSEIVTVPVMEGATDAAGNDVYGVIVNMNDYNIGADKGGAVEMFDDFDINYNQYLYLIETRISGALTKPYSAMVVKAGGEPVSV